MAVKKLEREYIRTIPYASRRTRAQIVKREPKKATTFLGPPLIILTAYFLRAINSQGLFLRWMIIMDENQRPTIKPKAMEPQMDADTRI